MKIIKNTFLKKNILGNFELKPGDGFELRTYVDYESKLLVVVESPIKKPSGVPYSTKQFIVDPKKGETLSFDQYKKYFSYEVEEIYSEDGKFKLESQRKHDFERGRDYKEERLIEIESGKLIRRREGTAFHYEKLKNTLEKYYIELEAKRKQDEKVAAQKTLEQHYQSCKANLKEGHFIFGYYNKQKVYKVIYSNGIFILNEGEKTSTDLTETIFKETRKFQSIEEFWSEFTKDEKWYLNFSTFEDGIERTEERIIAKFLIDESNKIRKSGNFTKDEHYILFTLVGRVSTGTIRRSEYKQYCPNCGNEKGFSARYPKSICGRCNRFLTDKDGRGVVFYNTEMMGYGCQGFYLGDEPKEKYNSTICYIGKDEFHAEEARFGGIVIQKK